MATAHKQPNLSGLDAKLSTARWKSSDWTDYKVRWIIGTMRIAGSFSPRHAVLPGQCFAMRASILTDDGIRGDSLITYLLPGAQASRLQAAFPTFACGSGASCP